MRERRVGIREGEANLNGSQEMRFATSLGGRWAPTLPERWEASPEMIEGSVREKLERFEASVENRRADGNLLEELVEQCASDLPDWEVSGCWPLRDYPRLSELGLEPHDDGIDLIAEKTDGRRGAIQCKLILPCGTGKTRVSMRIVEELCSDGDIAVVLVPSIALIGQVRLAYLQGLRAAKRDTVSIAVCSDKTAGLVRSEEEPGDDPTSDTGYTHAVEVGCRVAKSPEAVETFLREDCRSDCLNLIFSTYQSGHNVAEARRKTERYAEVLVCDEAHRTAQIKQIRKEQVADRIRNFTLCHDHALFPARYRLYQTATPKICSWLFVPFPDGWIA